MKNFIENVVPSQMSTMRIDADSFIKLYNAGQCEFVDIRVEMETKVWQVNFGLKIPAPELPNRLHELPKDKLIVLACPKADRSNMARTWLASQGFNVKYLSCGLLGLMDYLKGGKAKLLKV